MKTSTIIGAVLLLVAAAIFFSLLIERKRKARGTAKFPKEMPLSSSEQTPSVKVQVVLPEFVRKKPLTNPEQTLFFRLQEAFPEYVVLAQVQISRIVEIKKGPEWQSWFNKISRKSADFVLCQKDFSVLAVIELDDKTHEREDRIKADNDKNTAVTLAGYKLIRFKVREMPNIEEIKSTVGNCLKTQDANPSAN